MMKLASQKARARRVPALPTVSMLTAQGPYAEVINLGQDLAAKDARIANVSVMGGFAYGDTPFNGTADLKKLEEES